MSKQLKPAWMLVATPLGVTGLSDWDSRLLGIDVALRSRISAFASHLVQPTQQL